MTADAPVSPERVRLIRRDGGGPFVFWMRKRFRPQEYTLFPEGEIVKIRPTHDRRYIDVVQQSGIYLECWRQG